MPVYHGNILYKRRANVCGNIKMNIISQCSVLVLAVPRTVMSRKPVEKEKCVHIGETSSYIIF